MGRRKERRIAANAGRRVKLDLFAEPSGDLGSSSAQEAVGGEGDSKTPAELPSSPSSSANDQQNPLLLLEQYSDDELDEGSNEVHNRPGPEDASVSIDDEAKMAAREEAEDIEKTARDPTIEKMEQLPVDTGSASQGHFQKLEEGSITEIDSNDLNRGSNKIEEATYSAAPDEQLVGDVSSGWKMVLHEESNQYYYWNILTSETSWEVPDVLAQETITPVDNAVGDTEGKMYAVEDHNSSIKLNIDCKDDLQNSDTADEGIKMDASNEGSKGDSIDKEEWNEDANQNHGTSSLGRQSGANESHSDLSLQLVKQCESLLERLSDAEGLNFSREDQDHILKYKLEIGIRLADIKALASHGSSLLPFWLHSENRLKQLEAAIVYISLCQSSASPIGFEATVESREGIGHESGSTENKALLPSVKSHAPDYSEKSVFDAHNDGSTTIEPAPLVCYSSMYPVANMREKSETNGIREEGELTPGPTEYVDMDVDMEVEDDFTSIKAPAHYNVSTEIPNLQNTFANQETTTPGHSAPVEEWIPPPPPDNEPFPPPPPDDEPFPPPPPDEPPEISYAASSSLESVQPFPYSEQYHLSYPGSSLEYYGQPNIEPPGTSLYTHQEGGQVAVSHLPHYFEAVPNMYAVAPLVVNPVDSNAYYGIQSEAMNPVSLVSSVAVDSLVTGLVHADAGSNLLPKTNLDVIMSEHGTIKASPDLPNVRPPVGAPSTSSATNSVSIPSTSDNLSSVSAAAATATTSKVQSKVPRGKKRAVAVVSTLRANKKVSSLVDKWKAAKEELQEEEEEPEDAYEILEKKRQREIEEWRAHQIASGEAKDNANFQPLGGDWRERVKRKRAKKMKETGQSSSDVTDGNQQPDVLELSKGLPSGWQAYWDDSSKQVYYGNVLTSETTWTRPAD